MKSTLDRFQEPSQFPLWVLVLCSVGLTTLFVLRFPTGFDRMADIVLEGLYLGLAVLVVVPIRRLDSALLDAGWQVFVLGRLVDFLDELFVEPEPLVEPYISGFLMVLSLSIVIAGVYSLVTRRDEQISELQDRTAELSLKNKVIDEAPIGITIADMTREDEPLIDVNEAFTDITGYDPTDMLGQNCRVLQGDDTDPGKVAQMRQAIENGESVQVTLRNYRKDGTLFWNEITLAPLSSAGERTTYYAGFQQDATERKQLELALKSQRDNLKVLNQMLQHDIRNKLQLVSGRAQLLSDHVSREGREHVDRIETSADEAVAITESARELSEAMLEPEPALRAISLPDVLRDEIEDAASTFEDASIDVEGDIPDVAVTADEVLGSVFRNLLRNAVQHNDKAHPAVTVSVSTAQADGFVTVRVADNGPGVPDALQDDIFARGEKGLESEGTGIGTYLVDTLVTRYGGEAWIEDNQPAGAIFAVKLPVDDGDGQSTRR